MTKTIGISFLQGALYLIAYIGAVKLIAVFVGVPTYPMFGKW